MKACTLIARRWLSLMAVLALGYHHGQTGVAPNAIELHPILFFCSGYNC